MVTSARGAYGYRLLPNRTACAPPSHGPGPSGEAGRAHVTSEGIPCGPPGASEPACAARGCCLVATPAGSGESSAGQAPGGAGPLQCLRPRAGGGFEDGQGLVVASPGDGVRVRAPGRGGDPVEAVETESWEVAAIAGAAARLMQQPDVWALESAAALRRAREHFAPEAVVADLAALLGALGLPSDGGAAGEHTVAHPLSPL